MALFIKCFGFCFIINLNDINEKQDNLDKQNLKTNILTRERDKEKRRLASKKLKNLFGI